MALSFRLSGFHPAVELLPAVIGRRRHLQGSEHIGNGLSLVQELVCRPQLADDLLGVVAFALHGASPGQVWPVGKLSSGLDQLFWGSTPGPSER